MKEATQQTTDEIHSWLQKRGYTIPQTKEDYKKFAMAFFETTTAHEGRIEQLEKALEDINKTYMLYIENEIECDSAATSMDIFASNALGKEEQT